MFSYPQGDSQSQLQRQSQVVEIELNVGLLIHISPERAQQTETPGPAPEGLTEVLQDNPQEFARGGSAARLQTELRHPRGDSALF